VSGILPMERKKRALLKSPIMATMNTIVKMTKNIS
jgi:hypothetical protein